METNKQKTKRFQKLFEDIQKLLKDNGAALIAIPNRQTGIIHIHIVEQTDLDAYHEAFDKAIQQQIQEQINSIGDPISPKTNEKQSNKKSNGRRKGKKADESHKKEKRNE